MQNGGKRARHSVDQWDRQSAHHYLVERRRVLAYTTLAVMDRDRRLTGFLRGQTDNVEAPLGFELNNPWRVRIAGSYQSDALADMKQTERRIC